MGLLHEIEKGQQRTLDRKWNWIGVTKIKVRTDLIFKVWEDQWNVNILTNMLSPPADTSFCNNHGKAMKPPIMHDYMRYVDELITWQTLAPLTYRPGNGQISYFSIFWTLTFSIRPSLLPLVRQNHHTDNLDWHWWRVGRVPSKLRPQDEYDKPHPLAK